MITKKYSFSTEFKKKCFDAFRLDQDINQLEGALEENKIDTVRTIMDDAISRLINSLLTLQSDGDYLEHNAKVVRINDMQELCYELENYYELVSIEEKKLDLADIKVQPKDLPF